MRTGLLGASAAVAVGAVAVASGLLPGGDTFTVGSTAATSERPVQTRQTPELTTQGGATQTPTGTGTSTGAGAGRSGASPPLGDPVREAEPEGHPEAEAHPDEDGHRHGEARTDRGRGGAHHEGARAEAGPDHRRAGHTGPGHLHRRRGAAAEAEVLRLVNTERAKVGCVAVRPSAPLASLAGAFSADMAARASSTTRTRTAPPRGSGPSRRASPAWAARTSRAARSTRRRSWPPG
ncbi:CAP domain-containing protein [Streptomyces diastatochromogenes]|nr:CAP domain-containing protein [Streptomyces diastatochromogenes]